jgi:hypothetical protein
VAALKEVSK